MKGLEGNFAHCSQSLRDKAVEQPPSQTLPIARRRESELCYVHFQHMVPANHKSPRSVILSYAQEKAESEIFSE